MKKVSLFLLVPAFLAFSLIILPLKAEAGGWSTWGKVAAGLTAFDLLANRDHSLVGGIVTGRTFTSRHNNRVRSGRTSHYRAKTIREEACYRTKTINVIVKNQFGDVIDSYVEKEYIPCYEKRHNHH